MLQWTQGCLHFFWISILGFFGLFPEVRFLGQKAGPFLIFWGISILLSTVAAPVCIPTNSAKWLPFLCILTSTCCLLIYGWQPFWQVGDDSSLWFSFVFLWWLVTLSIFPYVLLAICMSSLEKCSFRSFVYYFYWVVFWCWVL